MGEVIEFVLQVFSEVVCYWVGRLFVPLLSFGYLQCESLAGQRYSIGSARGNSIYFWNGSQLCLTTDGTAIAGFLLLGGTAAAVAVFFWQS